jgi:predicted nucleic acid-binding protein
VTGYLLDTNILSVLSPTAAQISPSFLNWLEQTEARDELFLSVVTIHEIERGIGLLERKGATAKAGNLRLWLDGLILTYGGKILPIDSNVAKISGLLEANAAANGHHPGMADALIAGTAKAHGLTVVTRNVKHFEPFQIDLFVPDL